MTLPQLALMRKPCDAENPVWTNESKPHPAGVKQHRYQTSAKDTTYVAAALTKQANTPHPWLPMERPTQLSTVNYENEPGSAGRPVKLSYIPEIAEFPDKCPSSTFGVLVRSWNSAHETVTALFKSHAGSLHAGTTGPRAWFDSFASVHAVKKNAGEAGAWPQTLPGNGRALHVGGRRRVAVVDVKNDEARRQSRRR